MSRPCRVLFAEDNEGQIVLVETILKAITCDFTTVKNGLDAVSQVQRHCFHIVLMDFHMPVLNGAEAAQRIREWESREKRQRLPIVGITASAMPHEVQLCLVSGMDEVITKPFNVLALQALIVKYCRL
ncbi:MAG: response regulator [Acidobacteriota bacterium]